MKIIIFNCYPAQSRKNFDLSNVGHPQDLYLDFLSRYAPDAETSVHFLADMESEMPDDKEIQSATGVLWTGSDLTIYAIDPRVKRMVETARRICNLGIPSFGSCWGIQMAAVAGGGKVAKNPKGREWGIARNIKVTEAGKKSILLRGKPLQFDGFIMHLDEVIELPPGVEILAGNDHTHVQALEVRYGNATFFGTQYHPEYNLFEMGRLISARAEAMVNEGFFASEEDVKAYAASMIRIHKDPESLEARRQLGIGEDILSPQIREQELRNWVDYIRKKYRN